MVIPIKYVTVASLKKLSLNVPNIILVKIP